MKFRAIFFDIETTGLDIQKDRIIEIAAFCPETNKVFSSFVNPERPIPPAATAIHSIVDSMVADAYTFEFVGEEFLKFCQENCDIPVLIAHNGKQFDMPFVGFELARYQKSMPSEWKSVDSLTWSRHYRSDLPRHSLQFLRETFFIEAKTAHRALDDVMVLYEVFSDLIGDLPISSVLEKFSAINNPKKTIKGIMPFGKHQGKPLKQVPSSYLKWLEGSGALEKEENKSLREELKTLNLI